MSRAFTLIEMLVTVSLIAIITTFTVVNLNFERPERRVEQATREIYGTLLYARNLAVSGKVFKDQNADGIADVPNGYGVHINRPSLNIYEHFIYGDSMNGALKNGYFDWVNEEFMDDSYRFFLNSGINLYLDIDGVVTSLPGWEADYFFSTPRGAASFFYNFSPVAATTVTLIVSDKNDPLIQKSLVVKIKSGQIYVVD